MSRPADLPTTAPPAPPAALAALLPALPPSCGPVRLVAVDGHAGSGKTTFANRLAGELERDPRISRTVPVLHLDHIASHDAFFGWVGRLAEQVLDPLSQGRDGRYQVYDWVARKFPAGPEGEAVLPPEPVVIVEGVGAGRRALRPYLTCLLWMDMAPTESWRRGQRRDGPELTDFWTAWTRAEDTHFAEDPSSSYANFVVRQGVQGYEVRRGPAGHR